jgi:hypothetical protein
MEAGVRRSRARDAEGMEARARAARVHAGVGSRRGASVRTKVPS